MLGFCPGVLTTGFHSAAGGSAARFPRLLVQSPDAAARELARALRRRSGPRAVSGLGTRLFLLLMQMLSRKTVITMMGTSSPIRETP